MSQVDLVLAKYFQDTPPDLLQATPLGTLAPLPGKAWGDRGEPRAEEGPAPRSVLTPRGSRPTHYAFPWPDELPRLGRRRVGPYAPCSSCERWSWIRYGNAVLCLECVRRLERT